MDPPAGETPVAFKYKIDDGPTQTAPTSDETEPISLPGEGSYKLEYWSETDAGEEPQANHLVETAIVDRTDPTLSVTNDQNQALYVIKRSATVTIQAGDALSGLTLNPTAQGEAVGTDARGAQTVEWTAADLCDNRTTEQFSYTVLGPGLGERAVIEPLGDGVEVDLPGDAAAGVSQKGAEFEPVTQPREIPVGTTIDASEAGARITSSKSATEGDIKDGTFNAGIFQVLESRNQTANALTKLRLKGSNFRNCEVGKGASAARLSRRARRRLRGSATGRFRTSGRHSAATVRGTDWEVIDRCDGTLTKVERGEVAVRDFRLRKTVVVKEGKRYLALAEAPDPVLGKRVTVDVVKGKVFIKLPRGGKFARASQKGTEFKPLTSERSIPVRSILDTTRGTVALSSARNRKGAIQSGRFAAGVFQVLQSRKRREKGLTTLRLTGSAAKFKGCGGKRSSASARASLTRRQIRRLRARARGRYRTSGRYSAATVRGTTWTVTDRCDGTLTTVQRGKVAVRDFRLQEDDHADGRQELPGGTRLTMRHLVGGHLRARRACARPRPTARSPSPRSMPPTRPATWARPRACRRGWAGSRCWRRREHPADRRRGGRLDRRAVRGADHARRRRPHHGIQRHGYQVRGRSLQRRRRRVRAGWRAVPCAVPDQRARRDQARQRDHGQDHRPVGAWDRADRRRRWIHAGRVSRCGQPQAEQLLGRPVVRRRLGRGRSGHL